MLEELGVMGVIEQQRSNRGHHRHQRKHFAALAEEKGKEELGVFPAALLKGENERQAWKDLQSS